MPLTKFIMSSKLLKFKASILDVFFPTNLIPRPKITLSKKLFFEFSMDCKRLFTDLIP